MNFYNSDNDAFSSIDTQGQCVVLYEDKYCRGRSVEVTIATLHLSAIDFNDMASSMKSCNK
jgi:sulfur transfer complex TusBCD TusB component (DsrH family)